MISITEFLVMQVCAVILHCKYATIKLPIIMNRCKWKNLENNPIYFKKQGFKFMGTVTTYSYLEAIGVMVNHASECFRHHHKWSN